MKGIIAAALAWSMTFLVTVALAQTGTEPSPATFTGGTYAMQDGSYSIDLQQDGNNLVVVEPNKRSVYEKQNDGSYQFYNSNTGSTFGLRLIDARTVEVYRIPLSGSPARLVLVSAPAAAKLSDENDGYTAIAEHYRARAQSDSANAQAWTMCSAVALKRSMSDGQDFARYASQMAQVLKQTLVDTTNPCSDAIPSQYW